jgi:hypothetical protein
MNSLVEMANLPLACRVGWALLHSLWQGALGALVYALMRLLLRRHSAQTRYLVSCGLLLGDDRGT